MQSKVDDFMYHNSVCTYCAYFAYYIFLHILRILHISHISDLFMLCRYILRLSQTVYGFWYYFMIHRAIGIHLQKILPKLVPKTDAELNALLHCKLRVYVAHILQICIFCIFDIFCIFILCMCQAEEER